MLAASLTHRDSDRLKLNLLTMKIFIAIGIAILVIIVWIFLKSYPQPTMEGIELRTPEDKIPTEISPTLINEYENVPIVDDGVKEKLADNEDLWDAWIKSGYVPGNTLTVDFYFYTAEEQSAAKLKSKLEQEGFYAFVYPERTLIIFKGWQIKTQIRRSWDLKTLNQYTKVLGAISQEQGPYLEGSAAMIDKNKDK